MRRSRSRSFVPLLVGLTIVINALAFGPYHVPSAMADTPRLVDRPARSSIVFLDSVGVNTHLSYNDTPYSEGNRIQAALEQLGVRHIRDNLPRKPSLAYVRRIAALDASGIGTQLTVGAVGVSKGGSLTPVPVVMTSLSDSASFARAIEAIEGPNEWDARGGDDWVVQVRDYQCALYGAVNADPTWAGVPVVAPSVARRFRREALGNLEGCADWANSHTYVRGQPTTAEYTEERAIALAAVSNRAPVAVTETGYTNALWSVGGKHPVSDAVASVYIPRLFSAAFEAGVTRTFLYELVDQKNDRSLEDEEAHFGLLYNDLRPKPAYSALQRLLGLVTDQDAVGRAPSSLEYAITDRPPDLHELLLSRRDGTMLLLLWRDVPVHPLGSGDEVEPEAVEVQLARPVAQVDVHRPTASAAPVSTSSGADRVRGLVGADLVVLRIDATTAIGGPPMTAVQHAGGGALETFEGSAPPGADAFAAPGGPDRGRTVNARQPTHMTVVGAAFVVTAAVLGTTVLVLRRRHRRCPDSVPVPIRLERE